MGLQSKESTLLAENAVDDDDLMDDLSGEESESGSESEEEDVKLAEPLKNSIYNRDGFIEKLQDISCWKMLNGCTSFPLILIKRKRWM